MKVSRIGHVLVLASMLLAACGAAAPGVALPTGGPSPKMYLADCQLTAPGLSASVKARCGTWAVPEDRAYAAGRKVNLRLAIVAAVSRSPAPDPLFFIAGGPGEAATESFVAIAGAFEQIRQKRDIVLVDQRGTGQSGALRCAGDGQADTETPGTDAEAEARLKQELTACLGALHADPRFYTTAIAVQDLDDVRAALGYEKLNLYGISYGTRVAQAYMRAFPEHVRTAILDGVVPQDEALGMDVARDAQRALDLIFDRCASDPGCQAAFPNVRAEFSTLLTTLEKEPARVTLPHPVTGKAVDVTLTWRQVAASVRLLTYAPETVALLPLLIHTAAQGNYVPLAAQSLMATEGLSQSISLGVNVSVVCSEDAPFLQPEAAAQANRDTYLQGEEIDKIQLMCSIWPRGAIPADFKQPVKSDVPVLLLSGEADPVTPPANAARVAQSLSRSLQLVAPGLGHGVIFRGCLPRVAGDFVKSGTVQGLDTACVQDMGPLPFFTSFTGFQP